MRRMYWLRNKDFVVFAPFTEAGRDSLIELRKSEPVLKYSRLDDCIQAAPDRVKPGVFYYRDSGEKEYRRGGRPNAEDIPI